MAGPVWGQIRKSSSKRKVKGEIFRKLERSVYVNGGSIVHPGVHGKLGH